jgi:hypothetical protein
LRLWAELSQCIALPPEWHWRHIVVCCATGVPHSFVNPISETRFEALLVLRILTKCVRMHGVRELLVLAGVARDTNGLADIGGATI